jgi:glycosyltransferase involved in cell wall biosynthesis
MRAAIDATPLTVSSGGTTRYTSELSLALAAEFPGDEFRLVSDQLFAMPGGAPDNLRRGGGPKHAWERRWWSLGLSCELARSGADIFHGTDFAVPYVPARPAVLTLHDLSPWMDPAWHSGAARVRRRTPPALSHGLATMVITQTETIRRAAIERFRIHPSRVAAVPLGGLPGALAHADGGGEGGYFLFVGTLEPRKNVEAVVEAWRELRRECAAELIVAGRRREDFPEIASEPGLRVLGEVRDNELPDLYSRALALVYPSRYEGFGLPVVEGMQCGACVIVSRDPALLEVAGGAALAVSDVRELAGAMRALAGSPETAAAWREKAVRRGREFSWRRTARLTREVYEEAIRRFA